MADLLLIHTIPALVEVFDELCRKLLPSNRWLHILDEPLLELVRRRGRLAPEDAGRVLEHVRVAENLCARLVLVTCSTISPLIDSVREQTSLAVLKIDGPMLSEAVRVGSRIAVFATNPTTVEPTRLSLLEEAVRQNKTVKIKAYFVESALEALRTGDGEIHDRAVAQAIVRSTTDVDVIVLAQATMARCIPAIQATGCRLPVLSSPELAMREAARVLSSEF